MNQLKLITCLFSLLTSPFTLHATPNIVLIFTDDQGYADVGCYGAQGYTTPHLDQMAQDGLKFTDFYVPSPVCSASRSALLTGCQNARLGINGAFPPDAYKPEHQGLNPSETTIAEMLKAKGYATACVGKWHLGDYREFLPTRQGFDSYYGLPFSNDMWPFHPTAGDRFPKPLPLYQNETIIDDNVTPEDQKSLTKNYTAKAVEFIENSKDQPFFLYLAHSMPHVPLFTSPDFDGVSEQGAYGDVIQEIDWSVGQVLQTLKTHGLEENTLVIFTSDNGPWLSYGDHAGSAAPLREGKGTCWEGGVRVPGIMQWKGTIPAGTTTDLPCSTIDVFPTVAAMTGSALPEHAIDGLNILTLLKNPKTAKDMLNSPTAAESSQGKPTAGENLQRKLHSRSLYFNFAGSLQSLRRGHWKLILPHRYRTLGDQTPPSGGLPIKYQNIKVQTPELYHLGQDPSETKNLADAHPELLQELLTQAQSWREQFGDKAHKIAGSQVRPRGLASSEKK